MEIHGNLVDIHQKVIFPATVRWENGIITGIERNSHRGDGFILPGFVDAHLQLDSTLLPPTEFSRLAVRHGTIAAVATTPVIARILGAEGIEYMHLNARKAAMKFFFDPPLSHQVDTASTCLTEARKKLNEGMKIAVREGSVNRNFLAVFPVMQEAPSQCMFCTDHLYPDSLMLGHLNLHVRRAVQKGMDVFDALACASKNPAEHYNLEVGLLRTGDLADFIVVEDLSSFRVLETYIDGECVFKNGPLLPYLEPQPLRRIPSIKTRKKPVLTKGAIASSFAALGASKADLDSAIEAVMTHKGGLALSSNGKTVVLPLPIGGLMADLEGEEVARLYSDLDQIAKNFGYFHPLAELLSESYV